MSAPRVVKVNASLIVLENATGEMAAVARKVYGTDQWAVRRRDSDRVEFVTGEAATRTRLAEIGGVA